MYATYQVFGQLMTSFLMMSREWWPACLPACLVGCLPAYLSICLSVCLSACLPVHPDSMHEASLDVAGKHELIMVSFWSNDAEVLTMRLINPCELCCLGSQPNSGRVCRDVNLQELDLAKAVELLQWPLSLGDHPVLNQPVLINRSNFGFYVQGGNVKASLPKVSRMTHA